MWVKTMVKVYLLIYLMCALWAKSISQILSDIFLIILKEKCKHAK